MSKHTPTPYQIDTSNNYDIESYNEQTGTTFGICQMYADESMEANADFIVKACNCHNGLVEALQSLVYGIKSGINKNAISLWIKDAEQEIKKAESEE